MIQRAINFFANSKKPHPHLLQEQGLCVQVTCHARARWEWRAAGGWIAAAGCLICSFMMCCTLLWLCLNAGVTPTWCGGISGCHQLAPYLACQIITDGQKNHIGSATYPRCTVLAGNNTQQSPLWPQAEHVCETFTCQKMILKWWEKAKQWETC